MNEIKADELSETIQDNLLTFEKSYNDKLRKQSLAIGKKAIKKLKQTSPKRTTAYSKSWGLRSEVKNDRAFSRWIYSEKRYRLTHLLEHGHVGRNGKRTKAFQHIEPVEAFVIRSFIEETSNAAK